MNKNILFLVKFFAIFALLQTAVSILPLQPLNEWIAGTESILTGIENHGNKIPYDGTNFVITNSCTSLVSGSILAAIVFALRKPELKKKIELFAIGALALFAVNLLRVYLVILIGINFGTAAGDLSHTISWFAMSALIITLWFYLTKKRAGIKDFSELL